MSIIMNENKSGGDKAVQMQAVFNGSHEDHYPDSFRLLKKYIEESLDLYKEELQTVLFPIFLELFLSMVQGQYVAGAKKFFAEEKGIFQAAHKEDLSILEQVDDVNKLALPEIAKYLSNKFVVKISIYAFQLLIHFVKLNQLILLLQILNQNINFQLSAERNTVDAQGALCVLVNEDIQDVNQAELTLGKLPEFSPEYAATAAAAGAQNPLLNMGANIMAGGDGEGVQNAAGAEMQQQTMMKVGNDA